MTNDYKQDPRYPQALFDPEVAINLLLGRHVKAPDLEPILSTNSSCAYQYAERVLRDRFPQGEPAIFGDPVCTAKYMAAVLRKRLPCFEFNVCSYPPALLIYTSYAYVRMVKDLNPFKISPQFLDWHYDDLYMFPSYLEVYGLKLYILDHLSIQDRFSILNFYFDFILPRIKQFLLDKLNAQQSEYNTVPLFPHKDSIPDSQQIARTIGRYVHKVENSLKDANRRSNKG